MTERKSTKKGTGTVSDSHKAAMALGRKQAKQIRDYLDALEAVSAPKRRGRSRSPESIRARLESIDAELDSATSLSRVQLIQERMDLQNELATLEQAEAVNPDDFEGGFVEAVGEYSARKGLTYSAWRAAGVPAATLRKAGMARSN